MGECHSPPAHMALGYPYFPGKDVDRDLVISNAKNTYLQSDQQIEDIENLLNSVKLLVQQF